jgi:hypothetical protein
MQNRIEKKQTKRKRFAIWDVDTKLLSLDYDPSHFGKQEQLSMRDMIPVKKSEDFIYDDCRNVSLP